MRMPRRKLSSTDSDSDELVPHGLVWQATVRDTPSVEDSGPGYAAESCPANHPLDRRRKFTKFPSYFRLRCIQFGQEIKRQSGLLLAKVNLMCLRFNRWNSGLLPTDRRFLYATVFAGLAAIAVLLIMPENGKIQPAMIEPAISSQPPYQHPATAAKPSIQHTPLPQVAHSHSPRRVQASAGANRRARQSDAQSDNYIAQDTVTRMAPTGPITVAKPQSKVRYFSDLN